MFGAAFGMNPFSLAPQKITAPWRLENKTCLNYLQRQVAVYVCLISVNYWPFPLAVIRNTLHLKQDM